MSPRSGGSPVAAFRIAAVVLILVGALGLVYSRLSYGEDRTAAQVGPVRMMVRTDHAVDVPAWAAIAALAGGVLLLVGTSRAVRS